MLSITNKNYHNAICKNKTCMRAESDDYAAQLQISIANHLSVVMLNAIVMSVMHLVLSKYQGPIL
jgi:hypothetical protein